MSIISKRISQISESPTLSITAKAKKLRKEGIDIISFGAGEPDFDTPKNIKEAAKTALDKGLTKYTPTSGIKELKEAIIEKLKKENNLEYKEEEILISCGAKHSIFNAILTLVNEKDEVILPSPYWVSYLEMIKIAGAKPVILDTKKIDNFKIKPSDLKKSISKNTKLLILNSPSNPTGMVYKKEELIEISKILVENGIFCISDEIYERLVYDGIKYISIASLGEDIKKNTVVINGFSKSYSMTGWRLGYALARPEIIKAMSNLQDHSTSCPVSFAQYAAVSAFKEEEELKKMLIEFNKRRNYMVDKINSIKDISCIKPEGAFYCWVNIEKLFGKKIDGIIIDSSLTLAELLLTKARVAVVPGIAFGNDKYIRLSYATSLENIIKGLDRIEDFINSLS